MNHFDLGIDIKDLQSFQVDSSIDVARSVKQIARAVKSVQENFDAIEKVPQLAQYRSKISIL